MFRDPCLALRLCRLCLHHPATRWKAVLLSLVLGLEMSSRTNFESLALANQVLGLARLVICQTNNATMLNFGATVGRLYSTSTCRPLPLKTLSTIVQMRRFDKLRGLFSRLLCTPATSAPVERVFSQSRDLLRPHRARMSDTLLETLVFLKCNSAALWHVSPSTSSQVKSSSL